MAKNNINVLTQLEKLGNKIKHHETQSRVSREETARGEHLYLMKESIHQYIDFVTESIIQGAIFSDPLGIIYGKGFDKSSQAYSVAEQYLNELRKKEEFSKITAILIENGHQESFVQRMEDGTIVIYNKTLNLLKVIKGNAQKIFNTLKIKAAILYYKVKVFLAQKRKTITEWFSKLRKNEPNFEIVPDVEPSVA